MKVFVSGNEKSGFNIRMVYDDGSPASTHMNITHDKDWLWLKTDDYEGNAMINVEALPKIIKCLREIQKSRKLTPTAQD